MAIHQGCVSVLFYLTAKLLEAGKQSVMQHIRVAVIVRIALDQNIQHLAELSVLVSALAETFLTPCYQWGLHGRTDRYVWHPPLDHDGNVQRTTCDRIGVGSAVQENP